MDLFTNSAHRYYVSTFTQILEKAYRGKALKIMCGTVPAQPISLHMRSPWICWMGCPQVHVNIWKIDPHHWSRAHFKTKFKCDIILNNLSKCFNKQILEVGIKGIATMNEIIRTKSMIRIQKKRDSMKNGTTFHCPRVLKKLEKTSSWAGSIILHGLGKLISSFRAWWVNLLLTKMGGSCSCRKWKLIRVSCNHAISVIYFNKDEPENFINNCYKVRTFLEIYRHTLNPT